MAYVLLSSSSFININQSLQKLNKLIIFMKLVKQKIKNWIPDDLIPESYAMSIKWYKCIKVLITISDTCMLNKCYYIVITITQILYPSLLIEKCLRFSTHMPCFE